jgi:hypothetical protein
MLNMNQGNEKQKVQVFMKIFLSLETMEHIVMWILDIQNMQDI